MGAGLGGPEGPGGHGPLVGRIEPGTTGLGISGTASASSGIGTSPRCPAALLALWMRKRSFESASVPPGPWHFCLLAGRLQFQHLLAGVQLAMALCSGWLGLIRS